jgi:hypothetical protein
MQNDPLLYLVAGAFGASIVGLIGGFIGSGIQWRHEHDRWLREQRLVALDRFVRVLDSFPNVGEDVEPEPKDSDIIDELSAAVASIDLLGPRSVSEAAYVLMSCTFIHAHETHTFEADAFTLKNAQATVTSMLEKPSDSTRLVREARAKFKAAANKALSIKDADR